MRSTLDVAAGGEDTVISPSWGVTMTKGRVVVGLFSGKKPQGGSTRSQRGAELRNWETTE